MAVGPILAATDGMVGALWASLLLAGCQGTLSPGGSGFDASEVAPTEDDGGRVVRADASTPGRRDAGSPPDAGLASCPDFTARCEGTRTCDTDLRTSRLHCGACDAACETGERCVMGACERTPRAIAFAFTHSCAITLGSEEAPSTIACWGHNRSGSVGDGSNDERKSLPVLLEGLGSPVAVEAGGFSSCALIREEAGPALFCWGQNNLGQLGDGTTTNRRRPTRLPSPPEPIVSLAMGHRHRCEVLESRRVRCVGNNEFGQLGDGTTDHRSEPVFVQGLDDAIKVDAGTSFTCALKATGEVTCWGRGTELGLDATRNRATAGELVADPSGRGHLEGVVAFESGAFQTCAILEDRSVVCWGRGDRGELGNGTHERALRPIPVDGLRGAVQLGGGQHFMCALLMDGTIHCWGDNRWGNVGSGEGEFETSPTPIEVPGIDDAIAIELGGYHACAERRSGELYCWGADGSGQLATGEARRSLPGPRTIPIP